MERSKHYQKIALTILISGCAFLINYFISFFLAPYITDQVGTEAYGFVSMAKDFAVYATYITAALNSYATRFISVNYFKPDLDKANVYFSSTFWGNMILGPAIFALAMLAVSFLEHLLQVPPAIILDVKLLFMFVFLKFLAVTLFSVYSSGAYISNHLSLVGVFKGLSYVVEAIVLIVLFALFPPRVFYIGIAILAAALVIVLSNVWICKKYTGDLHVTRKNFQFSAVKSLVVNGIWTSVSQLGSFLNSGLDLTVCNLLLSPFAMGQLSLTHSIGVIFCSLFAMVTDAFKPMILKIYAMKDMPKLLKEYKVAMKTNGLVASLMFAGFLALGRVYYQLWVPHQDTELLYQLTLIVIASSILTCIESPLFTIYTLTLTRKVSCIFTLVTGFLNVASMYVCIKYFGMGIFAVVTTTLVLHCIIHLGPHPLYMAHVLKLPWHTFYPTLLRCLASCGVLSAVFYGLSRLYMPSSWITLIACAVVYSMIGSVLHAVVVLNKEDWQAAARRILRKKKA